MRFRAHLDYTTDDAFMLIRVLQATNCRRTPGVSCAAGGRLKGGGRGAEAGARQCACGRPLKDRELRVARSA